MYFQDITERKRAEAELLALKDRLDADLSAMTRLHELSTRLLAASKLQLVLEEILDASIELQGADFGNIQLYDRETGALEIVAHRGFDQDFLEYFSDTDENAACGRAMKRGERVVIEDVENDAEFEPHRRIAASAGFRAVQCTPLFDRNGELLGMLSTHFRQPHRPSERELRMTDLYARQAAEIIGAKGVEEALRENEEWLRLAEWAARSGTWEWDLASGEIRWSNQHRELFGQRAGDTAPGSQRSVQPPDSRLPHPLGGYRQTAPGQPLRQDGRGLEGRGHAQSPIRRLVHRPRPYPRGN